MRVQRVHWDPTVCADDNNRLNVVADTGSLCPAERMTGWEQLAGYGLDVRLVVLANEFQTDLLRTFRRHNNLYTTHTKVYASIFFLLTFSIPLLVLSETTRP